MDRFVSKTGNCNGNSMDLAWVDVDAFEPCSRMDAHDGMDGLDRLTANGQTGSSGAIRLGHRAVEGCQTLEVFLKTWAQ